MFGVFADAGFERVVECAGHCFGVGKGDCRVQVGCEVACVGAADAVDGHQCCLVAQSQFGHGCGGERRLAEEGQREAIVGAHVDERGEGTAIFQVAQHRAEARTTPFEQGCADGGDVVEVELVDERVVHAAVEAADVKALVYERGADDVVVAEVARYDDGGFACFLRLLQCGEARAFERCFFCHAGQVFWGEELADGAACVACDAGDEGVVLCARHVGPDQVEVLVNAFGIARQGGDDACHDPSHQGAALAEGEHAQKRHECHEDRVFEPVFGCGSWLGRWHEASQLLGLGQADCIFLPL